MKNTDPGESERVDEISSDSEIQARLQETSLILEFKSYSRCCICDLNSTVYSKCTETVLIQNSTSNCFVPHFNMYRKAEINIYKSKVLTDFYVHSGGSFFVFEVSKWKKGKYF